MAAETSESIGMFRDRGREVGGRGWGLVVWFKETRQTDVLNLQKIIIFMGIYNSKTCFKERLHVVALKC